MTQPSAREKVVSKLPASLRQQLKIRAAQHRLDIQIAVEQAIHAWTALAASPAAVDVSGASSFATFLPPASGTHSKRSLPPVT